MLGYILSALTIGFIVSCIALVFAQIYILIYGGLFFGIVNIIKVLFIILISVFSGSALMFFLISFIKTTNAFAVASTIVGTLVGFVSGAFFPVNALPDVAQAVVKVLPVSHSVMLIREVLMDSIVSSNIPAEGVVAFKQEMGVIFKFGDFTVTPLLSSIFLVVFGIVFFALGVIKLSSKKKAK